MLRKFKLGGLVLGSLLALVGCQSEKLVNESSSQGSQMVTLTASRGIQSRTNFDDEGTTLQLRWSAGDQIYVCSKDGSTYGTLTLDQGGENTTFYTFSGPVFGSGELYYSIYPVPDNNGKVELTEVEGTEYKIPMVGKIFSNSVAFETSCGINDIPNVSPNSETELNIVLGATLENSTELISLACIAEINKEKLLNEGKVELKYSPHPTKKTITLKNISPIGGKYYSPFDFENNKGKTVEYWQVKGTDKEKFSKEPVTIPTTNNKTLNIGVSISVSEDGSIKVADKKVVDDAGIVEIKKEEPVVVVPEVENNVTIEMPLAFDDNKTEPVVSIEEISTENATITIESKDENNDSEIENLTVILPSGITEQQVAEQVVIDMPNTTVTVKSADGNVLKIKEVIALTGDNTFIIKKGVVIENLIAMKGAIEVSGNVKAIIRGEGHHYGNNKVRVLVKKDGKIPSDIDKDEFEVEYEDENDVPSDNTPDYTQSFDGTVKTFPELQEALKYNGGLVRIGSDFAIEAPLTVTGNFELKMQYHKLTVAEGLSGNVKGLITNKGNLSISIGTFEGPETCPIKYFFWNEAGSSFNLRGVNIRTNGIYAGVLIEDGTSTIENFDVNTTSSIIASNLAINNGGTITIEGAEIEGNFINNNQGKITIKGGSVKGDLESNSPQGIITLEGVEPNGKGWPTSGSIEEEDPFDGPIVTIQNVSLSQALLKSLDNGIIRINETTNYAEIPQSVVGEIDYLELKGMSEAFTLSGLEVFTSLERLVVIQNTFTSFSVSGLPSTIKHFSIAENNALANLTFDANSTVENLVIAVNPVLKKLDVTNITNIVELVVTENATLNEIELPEDNQIKALVANRNALSTIDLSGCGDSLMELGLEENQLTTLEVKNFKNLKHIGYNGNPLTEVNFSGCSSLMDFHMENKPMTKVNLSGCTSLSRIYCNSVEQNGSLEVLNLSGCSGLKELYCSGHHLQELDLRSAAKLENIQCGKQIDDQGQSITIKLMLHPNLSAKWEERWGQNSFNLPHEIVTTSVEQGQGSNGGANFPIEGIY